MTGESDPYAATGVDYDVLDKAKLLAQHHAGLTSANSHRLGAVLDDRTRGEPATVMRIGTSTIGFVLECLGTKSMIARAFEETCGIDHFDAIGYDTVASAVNDCLCVGALPMSVNAYFATGSASFYEGSRYESLVSGFARGCNDAGATWAGGESPTLTGLVDASEVDLAASAIGIVPDGRDPILGEGIRVGDAIVLISSSGLHANGASLARGKVASELNEGWAARLSSGRMFGEAILDESVIYRSLIEAIFDAKLALHYASHITGHGLRKLMRADRELTYRIEALPPIPEVLAFLIEKTNMSAKDAYGTLNMGAGFALFVPSDAANTVVDLAQTLGYGAMVSGVVEQGPRRVVLEPIDVVFEGRELELR